MPIQSRTRQVTVQRRLGLCRQLIVLLVALLVVSVDLPLVHAASIWYVAPTGNDANNCQTAATACKTISAAISKTSSNDTIIIAAGTYIEKLTIPRSLALTGAGSAATIIDGSNTGRVVTIDTSIVTVHLNSLTIRNGNVGMLTGGGIYNAGTLTLANSVVRDNIAGSGGGGIINRGELTLVNTSVVSNTVSPNSGGGILNDDGKHLTVIASTISNNRGNGGSGILNGSASYLAILNSTLSDNTNISTGVTNGGGILNFSGTVVLTNTTIAANVSGVFNVAPGTITARNSIIARNITGGDCNKSITSAGYNLDSDGTCVLNATGDLPNTDPKLGSLQNNGGPTFTQALLIGSPAIDAGDSNACPNTDQRGVGRPQGNGCDMGAYERVKATLTFLPLVRR